MLGLRRSYGEQGGDDGPLRGSFPQSTGRRAIPADRVDVGEDRHNNSQQIGQRGGGDLVGSLQYLGQVW